MCDDRLADLLLPSVCAGPHTAHMVYGVIVYDKLPVNASFAGVSFAVSFMSLGEPTVCHNRGHLTIAQI